MMLGNRNVGRVDLEKKAFITHRNQETHLYRMWNGLGFNKFLMERLEEKKEIKEVWVFLHKNETVLLKTTPKEIIEKGVPLKNPKDIKDNQYIMPITEFKTE